MIFKEGDQVLIKTNPGNGHGFELLTPVEVKMTWYTPNSYWVIELGNNINLQQVVRESDLISLEELKLLVLNRELPLP